MGSVGMHGLTGVVWHGIGGDSVGKGQAGAVLAKVRLGQCWQRIGLGSVDKG